MMVVVTGIIVNKTWTSVVIWQEEMKLQILLMSKNKLVITYEC